MILQVPKRMPTHVHHQVSPNTEWMVNHFLGKFPSVTTTDEDGGEMKGKIVYVNANTVRVEFSNPKTGWAYLN